MKAPTETPRLLEVPEQPTSSSRSQDQSTLSVSHPQPRQNRNVVVLAAGAAFFAFSLLITRRSFARKRLASKPSFYTDAPANNQHQAQSVSGPTEALEALSVATVNVLSVAMLSTGSLMWYFDINSMADARRKLRGGLGVDGSGRDEQEAEEDFEEWMASVLSRKEAKEKKDIEEKRFNERGKER